MEVPFKKCDILIPKKGVNYNLWSVIACDQYTSQPEYWDKVKELVGNNPSTYNIILPEVYLENEKVGEVKVYSDRDIEKGGIIDYIKYNVKGLFD